jgi:glycosidase/S-formylglutathione hydrolase FrmB
LSPTFALLLLLTVAPSSNTTPAVQQSTTQCCTATIRVRVPEGTDTIYLAGNLPQLGPWRPDGLALMGGGGGRERVGQITVPRGVAFEYKFTLGSWEREALGHAGTVPPNHQLLLERDTVVVHEITDFKRDPVEYIADWKGSGLQGRLVYWTDVSSTFLEPTRHVEIWLPPGYDDSPTTRYPVLYMHDGQNLFDPRIANTGVDWGVDEAVVRLVERGVIPPVIVVGAWSTAERHPEYSPWHGAPDYARFLIEELMPRVNREFRTLTGPENTAVMGSSMGGLLSFYLVTRHPDVFGACGCVSTHFPISEAVAAEVFPGFATGAGAPPDTTPYIIRDIATGLEVPAGTRYWFDHGTEGLDSAYAPTHAVVRSWLLRQGLVEGEDFVVRQYDGATHNEAAWRARLEDPLRFLFGKSAKAQVLHDSDWRDGGVCYEIFVRSFSDSDGDGVGDIEGVIRRLDYVNDGDPDSRDDLGARCIWLMPIHASPSYHGYDVTDYYRIDPEYGTNADFRRLIAEAHRRGIRVLIDMVVNHASSQHPFFKHALLHTDSPYRDWFRWSDTLGPPNEWGDNNWRRSPVREEYYYGFFWHTMPDLNWESAAVREEMKRIATFWLDEMDADGLRLDAIRHLMEDGGRSTNVPRTHDMLREYAAHIRAVAPDAFTIGEVFDSTDALLAYYPDQLDAYFAFEVADAILTAVRTGSSTGLLAAVLRLQDAVPANRWSPFLRNHDQTRTLTWLEGDVARARLAASLLLTLPGVPFVYYGEEIGMTGDKPDPRIRTPMHWSLDPAAGFTDGMPWEPLQPDSFTANVQAMNDDPNSLLNHYRKLIHLRAENPALGSGELVALDAESEAVTAYLRRTDHRVALVVANLGTESLTSVTLSSQAGVLPAGRYVPEDLLGDQTAAQLAIRADGRLRGYVPLPSLAPHTAHVFDIPTVTR